jgi:hypothetical protein
MTFIKGIYLLNTIMLIIIAFTTIAGCHFQNATKTTHRSHYNTIQYTVKQAQEETSRATTIRTPNAIPSDNKRGHAANSNPAKESTSSLGGTV